MRRGGPGKASMHTHTYTGEYTHARTHAHITHTPPCPSPPATILTVDISNLICQAKCLALRTFSSCLAANQEAPADLRSYMNSYLEIKLFEVNCTTYTQVELRGVPLFICPEYGVAMYACFITDSKVARSLLNSKSTTPESTNEKVGDF